MNKLAIPAAMAALMLASAPEPVPADVDFGIRARIGDVHVGVRSGDGFRKDFRRPHRPFAHRDRLQRAPDPRAPLLFGTGPVNDFARSRLRESVREAPLPPRKRFRRHRPRFHDFGHFYVYDDYVSESERYVELPPPPEPETEIAEPLVAVEPPDARGPRWEAARGRSPAGAPYAIGQPLPRGVPHVALDWEDYGLPRPPVGQGYARFGDAVLLIDLDTRIVRQVLWPSQG